MALQSPTAATCWRPGSIILTDTAANLADNEMVRKAYLGEI